VASSTVTLQAANLAETELDGGIDDTQTTIDVVDASVFPSTTPFLLTIDDNTNVEIVKVTGISTNTLTVERGQEDTTGTSFASGTLIENRITAGTYEALADADWVTNNFLQDITSEPIEDLTDVSISSVSDGEALTYDGKNWTNTDVATQSELDTHAGTATAHQARNLSPYLTDETEMTSDGDIKTATILKHHEIFTPSQAIFVVEGDNTDIDIVIDGTVETTLSFGSGYSVQTYTHDISGWTQDSSHSVTLNKTGGSQRVFEVYIQ